MLIRGGMLIRGDKLNAAQRREVLAAYVHRHYAIGPRRLHYPYQTEAEWLAAHAFYFVKDGSRLAANRRHCEPASMAP